MNIYLFYHSVVSDWNHGNAHFLRGIVSAMHAKGHSVTIYEPSGGWSYSNLIKDHGDLPLDDFEAAFPKHKPVFYEEKKFDPSKMLKDADLVLVHEWNNPEIVNKIGTYRQSSGKDFVLLFHDTHHRSVSDVESMKKYDLSGYDGVLAFGDLIREIYRTEGWAKNAWTWHEAADISHFYPREQPKEKEGDLVWIGNWGDEERTEEIYDYIIKPVKKLGLRAKFYGVRYPQKALNMLKEANIEYGGWLPNYKVPEVFAQYHFTVHVPRRFYSSKLPGIPTIRPFEAMACGIPIISAPWHDTDNLFTIGKDYLMAFSSNEMADAMDNIMKNPLKTASLAMNGLKTIRSRHTCTHRVNELLEIYDVIKLGRDNDNKEYEIKQKEKRG